MNNKNKILIPLITISIGALAYLAYHLSFSRKKKITPKDLEKFSKIFGLPFNKMNAIEYEKGIKEYFQYDW